MLGKLIGAYLGEKLMARTGRGASGAIIGAGTAAIARRGIKPLALLLAVGYGASKLTALRRERRTRRG